MKKILVSGLINTETTVKIMSALSDESKAQIDALASELA